MVNEFLVIKTGFDKITHLISFYLNKFENRKKVVKDALMWPTLTKVILFVNSDIKSNLFVINVSVTLLNDSNCF